MSTQATTTTLDGDALHLDSLRRRMAAMHTLWYDAVATMDLSHVNHFEREGVLPIAFSLFHYTNMQDVSFSVLAGVQPIWNAEWQERVQMAIDEINAAGGVLGEPLEIIVEDTKADPATAVAAFEKLMTEDGVEFIGGGYSSGVTLALVESFRTFQPIVSWIGGATSGIGIDGFDGIEELIGTEPWFFHVHPWDYQNTQASSQFAVFTGANTVALLHENSAFGGPGAQAAAGVMAGSGQEVVLVEPFQSTLTGGNGDFRAVLSKVAAADPDMIFWIGYDGDVVPLTSQIRELNLDPQYVFGAPPGWPSEFDSAPEVRGGPHRLPAEPAQPGGGHVPRRLHREARQQPDELHVGPRLRAAVELRRRHQPGRHHGPSRRHRGHGVDDIRLADGPVELRPIRDHPAPGVQRRHVARLPVPGRRARDRVAAREGHGAARQLPVGGYRDTRDVRGPAPAPAPARKGTRDLR